MYTPGLEREFENEKWGKERAAERKKKSGKCTDPELEGNPSPRLPPKAKALAGGGPREAPEGEEEARPPRLQLPPSWSHRASAEREPLLITAIMLL